jgi:hypothetical protein
MTVIGPNGWSVPRHDTARDDPLVFEFSGMIVKCWRCHDEIELLIDEDPKADHLCADCDDFYSRI